MTRYQAATSTLSTWLVIGRAPTEHRHGTDEVRGVIPVPSLGNPSMVVRLWQTAARWAAAAMSALMRAVS